MGEMSNTGVVKQEMPMVFVASSKSQAAKSRMWMWGGFGIGLVLCAMTPNMSLQALFFLSAFLLPFLALMDWVIRRQIKLGKALITLGTETIKSPNFTGKRKEFAWHEIAAISVEADNGIPSLQLKLMPKPGLSDKRRFLPG